MTCPSDRTDADLSALNDTLFLLWGYPELTQTFIHREIAWMQQLGSRVNLLAARRIPRVDLDAQTQRLVDQTLFLGKAPELGSRASAWLLRHPRRFARTLAWTLSLPHRTPLHRARMVGMLLAAAGAAERVHCGGYAYLHAHFAGYHTEWAMCLSRLLGLPYGFTAHASGLYKDRNLLTHKVRGARLVMTCTQFNAEHLRQLAPDAVDRIHLVRHGLDLRGFGPPSPQPATPRPHWLAVGRLIQKKGFHHLIAAVAKLKRQGRPARVTLLGAGPLEEALRTQAAEHRVQDLVEFRGAVTNSEVLTTLRQVTGLVAPSIEAANGDVDGIPNVLLEAAAVGRPVIGSAISGIPEAIEDGRTGLLVPPGDVEALADAMDRIGADANLAAAMGHRGRLLIERDYDVEKNTRMQLRLVAAARYAAAEPCREKLG